jgi:hypothetical protein
MRSEGSSEWTHLEKNGVSEESIEVFLTLPPVVKHRNIGLGVVRVPSVGTLLIADECSECIETGGHRFEGLGIVHDFGEAWPTKPVAGGRALATHTVNKLGEE